MGPSTGRFDVDAERLVASPIRGRADELKGCFTAIITPQGDLLGEPLRSGEGEVIGDLDFALIDKRKAFMDSSGHYSRPELLSLLIDPTPSAHVHKRRPGLPAVAEVEEKAMAFTDPKETPFDGGVV